MTINNKIEVVCRNCGTIYKENIKICEVCGKNIDYLPSINIELPNNSIIGDKYAMSELAKKIAKQIFEDL